MAISTDDFLKPSIGDISEAHVNYANRTALHYLTGSTLIWHGAYYRLENGVPRSDDRMDGLGMYPVGRRGRKSQGDPQKALWGKRCNAGEIGEEGKYTVYTVGSYERTRRHKGFNCYSPRAQGLTTPSYKNTGLALSHVSV